MRLHSLLLSAPVSRHAVLLCMFIVHAVALSAPQLAVNNGIFFEAENYDGKPWYSDQGFGVEFDEPLASGNAVLIGMWKPGGLSYRLEAPQAGDYHVWMRCAVPADATVRIGANVTGDDNLEAVHLPATTTMEGLAAPGAYQWRSLGTVELAEGENTFILGQGPQRPDCLFLTTDPDFAPGEEFLAVVATAAEQPVGVLLPELTHDRKITQHPKWLSERGFRPAYAHFEWDRSNTPGSWAQKARETGATCLVGVGEMPAGTLDGKMRPFAFRKIDDPDFSYPDGYRPHDHSWVQEYVDAGHAEGLKVVLYGGSYRTLDPLLVEHPEWRQLHPDGKPYRNGFGSWHSPYRQAYIDRWVQVAQKYGMDGIMVDMLFTCPPGGDYSSYTVQAFKDKFGVEPPRTENPRDLTWQRWIDFQTWTREEVMLDVTEALHAVNPEIACIWNQTVGWIFNGREYLSSRAGECADGLLEEMGWEVAHGVFRNRPAAWPLQSAWQSLFLRCRTAPGYGQMWHLNGFYTRVNHQALSFSMFANGIAPAVVTGGNWTFMASVWDHIAPCEPPMAAATLMPYAALHFSENTLRWHANADGSEARRAYMENLFGLFQALLETHIPVAIITDDDLLDSDKLARYAVVILPNSACISDRQAQALTAFVNNGGGLLATFEAGMYDENGTRRTEPVLKNLLGVMQGKATDRGSWSIRTEQSHPILDTPEITEGGDPGQGLRERRKTIQFFRENQDRKAGAVQTSAGDTTESVPLAGLGTGFNLLHTRTDRTGRTVYFPPDIGRAYFAYNHPITRLIIERAVYWAAQQKPPVQTNAPLAVQTVCYTTEQDALVHLVNDNSSFGRAAAPNPENFGAFRAEVLPVYNIDVSVNGAFRKAVLLPEGLTLPIRSEDGTSAVTVPRVDIHAMVVFSH